MILRARLLHQKHSGKPATAPLLLRLTWPANCSNVRYA